MKRKNRILNIIMVLLAFVMVGGAVMYAGSLRGWFDKNEDISFATVTPGVGSCSIEREGVGFSLGKETNLRDKDTVKTSLMSTLSVKVGNTDLVLGSDSSLFIDAAAEEKFVSELSSGEMFLKLKGYILFHFFIFPTATSTMLCL